MNRFALAVFFFSWPFSLGYAGSSLESMWNDAAKTFGLGAGAAPQYEGANEYRPVPFVVARLRWGARYFVGSDWNGFRADVVGSRFIEAGPAVSLQYPRNHNAADDVIARLPAVDAALEVGGFLALNFPFPMGDNEQDALTVAGFCLPDVLGGHDGYTVATALLYRGRMSRRWILQTGPYATFASDRFMASYYGVTEEGSRASGLAPFTARKGWKDMGFRVDARYVITRTWNLNGTLSYGRFVGDAKRSPIIAVRGSVHSFFGGLALGYSF